MLKELDSSILEFGRSCGNGPKESERDLYPIKKSQKRKFIFEAPLKTEEETYGHGVTLQQQEKLLVMDDGSFQVNDLFTQGLSLQQRGDYDGSIDCFDKTITFTSKIIMTSLQCRAKLNLSIGKWWSLIKDCREMEKIIRLHTLVEKKNSSMTTL